MSSSLPKIKVGCPHFRSSVKQIMAENNTLNSAMSDIIDNVHGIAAVIKQDISNDFVALCDIKFEYDEGTLYKIKISDNIPHGFKDIHESSTNNPLNMGHIRSGQTHDDRETSEFGTGLKKALIYLAKEAVIYTRVVDNNQTISYVCVIFDFVEMSNRIEPQISYEPTSFEHITEETFKMVHPYETGSSIILTNLRNSDITFDTVKGVRLDQTEFEDNFRREIGDNMSDIIRDNIIQITVNDKIVQEKVDLIQLIQKNKFVNTFYVEFNGKGDIIDVYREGHTPTKRPQIMQYDANKVTFKRADTKTFEIFKQKPSVNQVNMTSLTTKGTCYEENHQCNDMTAIKRNGRCFGSVKITKQEKDGYSNHIHHEIKYMSKKLNMSMGVGSNKRVVSDKNNMLMSAIHITQKEINSKLRKYCKDKQPIIESSSSSDSEDSVVSIKIIKSIKKKPVAIILAEEATEPEVVPDVTQIAPPITQDAPITPDAPPIAQDAPIVAQDAPIVAPTPQEVKETVTDSEWKQHHMTVSEGMQILIELLKDNNTPTVIEQVNNILISYINNNHEAMIALKYVPMDNSRIKMLLDIMYYEYPTIEVRDQPINEDTAGTISRFSK